MIIKLSFIIQCLVFPLYTIAQEPLGRINGRLVFSNSSSAANIRIGLKISNLATFSDSNGFFVLEHLPAMHDTLIIEPINAPLLTRSIILGKDETLNIGDIRLQHFINQLQDVEIAGHNEHSWKSDYSFFGNKTETLIRDIPQSISSVTKELIQEKMEFTLKDVVDEVSGMNQYSGYDEYTIRGFRAENAREINGLRGYNTTYTSSMLVNIERVEVIKGPTATLYGNCDPGGTINLVTKKPLESYAANISLYYGNWGHFRAQTDVTGPLNKKKTLLFRFNAGYDNTNSFRNGAYAQSWEVAPSATYAPNDKFQVNIDLSLSHIITVIDRGQPGFLNDASLQALLYPFQLSNRVIICMKLMLPAMLRQGIKSVKS